MYPKMRTRRDARFSSDSSLELPFEEDSIYTKRSREHRVNEGRMHNWEDAFMTGYEEGLNDLPEEFEESYEEHEEGIHEEGG